MESVTEVRSVAEVVREAMMGVRSDKVTEEEDSVGRRACDNVSDSDSDSVGEGLVKGYVRMYVRKLR